MIILCRHSWTYYREEAEGASELVHLGSHALAAPAPAGPLGVRISPDALGVHGNRGIHSFDEACVYSFSNFYTGYLGLLKQWFVSRRSDMGNERLPHFNPDAGDPLITALSMRQENREDLIKKALEEDEDGENVVERLADRIARGRKPQGRPRALKRFETA